MEKILISIMGHIEWFLFGMVGIVLSLLKADPETVTRKEVVIVLISGLVCSFLLPILVEDFFKIKSVSVLYISAFCGGLLGMRIVAALYKLDVENIVKKRIGGK